MSRVTDTIVAVGSPPGRSPRGVVRLSGPGTAPVLDALARPRPARKAAGPKPSCWPSGCMVRCRLRPGAGPTVAGWAMLRRGPRTYTGQDLAEVQCPGNPALLERVVRRALEAGARPAEPGEFTFRAYLAGRMDLTQAEGIAATIAAATDGQLAAARHLRQGALGRLAADLVDLLAGVLARVEAGIDFVDQDDVVSVAPAELAADLDAVAERLDLLLARSRTWRSLEALPRVVLAGAPSVGKSTLYNALLGRRRALTSPAPGTTRDVLAEPLALRGPEGRMVEVMLVDLAGLDEPAGALDAEVQAAARAELAGADLVLHVLDGRPWPPPPTRADVPVVRVRTKADLMAAPAGAFDVRVSGRSGAGLDRLRLLVPGRVGERGVGIAAETLALRPRHDAALRAAAGHVAAARQLVDAAADRIASAELVAGAMRAALDELGRLGGRLTPDDILGRVFAGFCIGK